jgi:hypothetical protein
MSVRIEQPLYFSYVQGCLHQYDSAARRNALVVLNPWKNSKGAGPASNRSWGRSAKSMEPGYERTCESLC